MPHLETGSGRLSQEVTFFRGLVRRHDHSSVTPSPSWVHSTPPIDSDEGLWTIVAHRFLWSADQQLKSWARNHRPPKASSSVLKRDIDHTPSPKCSVVTASLSSGRSRVLVDSINAATLPLSMHLGVGRIQKGHIESRSIVRACDRSIDQSVYRTQILACRLLMLSYERKVQRCAYHQDTGWKLSATQSTTEKT